MSFCREALKALRGDPPDDEAVDRALAAAVEQVRDREYATELTARGASPVHAFAVAFHGKRAWVRSVELA